MFDPANHNLQPGDEEETARDMNKIAEALSDGIDFSNDAGPVFTGFASIASRLVGKPKSEVVRVMAKAGVANVFDELAEAGKL